MDQIFIYRCKRYTDNVICHVHILYGNQDTLIIGTWLPMVDGNPLEEQNPLLTYSLSNSYLNKYIDFQQTYLI